MGARTKARKRALDVIFEAEQRAVEPLEVLARLKAEASEPLNPWVTTLVEGLVHRGSAIDEVLETYSEGWALSRMPSVDRALARIGAYEILFEDSVDPAVTVDEIVNLASELSTEESPVFLNGLLGRIASIKDRLTFD